MVYQINDILEISWLEIHKSYSKHVHPSVPCCWCLKSKNCWDLRLEKLSKYLSKIMIAAEGVESKHSTSWKHEEWMISSSIIGDRII